MTKTNFTIMQRMSDIATIPTATYGEDRPRHTEQRTGLIRE